MKSKKYVWSAVGVIGLVVLLFAYCQFLSPTKIATLNFPDFTVEKFIRSNDNSFVKIYTVDLDEVEDISDYDMVLVRIHGASLTQRHLDAIKQAIADGVPVFSTESDNTDINSLKGRELEYVSTLMDNGSVKNYRSLFNYIRKKIDKKIISNGTYEEPTIVPANYFFHLGDDCFFSTYEEYQKYYEEKGLYKEGAPRVALLSGNINMQNSNEEHMAALIQSLEDKGLNVYPINSFGYQKLGMISAVKPNLIINRPHGRLLMGGGEAGVDLIKKLNVPILAPVTVSELYDKWLDSKQGMTAGGMTSMSVVLPELDGAIASFAVAAQFERDGRLLFDAIPQHTEKFCRLVKNFTELQTKKNSEKKIAIYYYKGTGKSSVSAGGLEGIQSLYNTLKTLKKAGYKVEGLPSSAKALEAMVQKSGSVLGPYALGAYDEFLKHGNPELVDVDTFQKWASEQLPAKLVEDLKARYGEAPGEYMGTETNGKKQIAVARITFGNVTILPQPLPAVGEDVNKLVHGTEGAPAYPYVASYLWTRNGFKADAVIHFGTHGSLEFIPGKQIALSDYDWSDALIADMPHFYIYTISNIGEGIIAKRRSYATLVSHLTAPFMQGESYGDIDRLHHAINKYETLENGSVKQQYAETITRMAKKLNIFSALHIDSTRVCVAEDIDRIHMYIEEIDGAKVSDGLYTLGKPYTKDQVDHTARLMNIDAVRYALASMDVAKGNISSNKLDDLVYIVKHYTRRAEQIIQRAFTGTPIDQLFREIVGEESYKKVAEAESKEKKAMKQRMAQMRMMMDKATEKKQMPKFLDEEGNLLSKDGKKIEDEKPSMMDMMKMMGNQSEMMEAVKKAGITDKEIEIILQKVRQNHLLGMQIMKKMNENQEEGIAMLKKMLTGDDEKNPSKEKKGKSEMTVMDRMAQAAPESMDEESNSEKVLMSTLRTMKETLEKLPQTKVNLRQSTTMEQEALIDGLNGGYVETGSAGDPIVNSLAVPTGKNFYSINPETTPTAEAWKVGKRLAQNLLDAELKSKGKYPEKVSFTMWATDFISSEGATIAQVLYLLGVEPLRDGFGYIRSLKLIPKEQLGRPRVDVVVQTSGQLRDLAASRLALINRAIAMAGEADEQDNFVRKGLADAERFLLEKGFSPVDARKYARERIFGGANNNYGSGIMGMVEKGDSWEDNDEIAQRYIQNMGALYSANGEENWGEMREGVFEAALQNTEVVVQPRSSNTWGPLSLDHVYEFMGGLSAAVRHVTGNDPTGYFNDFRNTSRAKVQELKEAIGVETNSTLFNPKYISHMMAGEASAMDTFAETFRNTYGWNAMKPSAIDQHIWNKYYDVYVKDELNLGLEKTFRAKNPYALQEMTAVMLESARKGMWKASEQQIRDVAKLHGELVKDHQAGCSGFICDNQKLRDFISQNLPEEQAKNYRKEIKAAREVQLEEASKDKNVVLKKENMTEEQRKASEATPQEKADRTLWYVIGILFLLLGGWVLIKKRAR